MKWLTFKKSGRRLNVSRYSSLRFWSMRLLVEWSSRVQRPVPFTSPYMECRASHRSGRASGLSRPAHRTGSSWASAAAGTLCSQWDSFLTVVSFRGPKERKEVIRLPCASYRLFPYNLVSWWEVLWNTFVASWGHDIMSHVLSVT